MSLSSLSFPFEEAARNIRRNGLMSLAALSTVAVAMAVLGGALFALYRLDQFAEAQPRQFEVSAFVRDHVSRERVDALRQRIRQLPGVASVRLYPREQAWADLQREDRERGEQIAGSLDVNPLPDALHIRLSDPEFTGTLGQALRDRERFPEIEKVQDAREAVDLLGKVRRVVRNVGGSAAALLLAATAFMIQNTIRLTVLARRREIRIMQLVGATPGFIRMPLLLEGVFYGVAGAALASGIVLFAVSEISQYAGRIVSPLARQMPPAVGPWVVLGVLVGLGGLIGFAGSVLSIRRFLKRV